MVGKNMKSNSRLVGWTLLALALTTGANATLGDPEKEAHIPSQAAADALRKVANTDLAFIPAGVVKNITPSKDLAELLLYPTDQVCVVSLSGSQVKQAMERSVALYPMGSGSFLQISGLTVTFNGSAPADKRIVSAILERDKRPVDGSAKYTVAMPATLARGGLGYFKVWSRDQIVDTLAGVTFESVLKGKGTVDSAPRWVIQ